MTEEASANLSYDSLKTTNGTLIADVNHALKSMCMSMSEKQERGKERECDGRWWGRAPEAKSNAIP